MRECRRDASPITSTAVASCGSRARRWSRCSSAWAPPPASCTRPRSPRRSATRMTPDDIIALMKKGNERFRLGKESPHDYLAQQKATATGQYPGGGDPELHRFPGAGRDDHGSGHRRLLQRARGRQRRQRRHRRKPGVRLQGGRGEGGARDGAHRVRSDQGRDRQVAARETSPGCSPRSAPPWTRPSIRASAPPRTTDSSMRSPARMSS